MAPDAKSRLSRYNWGNLPPAISSLLKAFGKKGTRKRFRYPAEIKSSIMKLHRDYNDASGPADDCQRWLGVIAVFVQHKPGNGEQSYWYFDSKRAEVVSKFLDQEKGKGAKKIRRPAALSDERKSKRAALLHSRYGKEEKSGPEIVPMSSEMERLRREHQARTGEHTAVAVPVAEVDADEVSVEEAATVADDSAPFAEEPDPSSREYSASLSMNHATLRRVLFCTKAEWWTWEHLVLLQCDVVGHGRRVGVGENEKVLGFDLDLDSADGDKPDLVDCMAAIDRFVEYRLIERLGDSGGGHGTYQLLVDPKAFYVVLIDERRPISTEAIYIMMVKAMMNDEGPGHNQSGWEIALDKWIVRCGWALNAGTVRNKACGTSVHPFDPAKPYKRWCIWYHCVLSEGFSRWLLAWPGFTVVDFDSRVGAPRQVAPIAAPAQPATLVDLDSLEEPEPVEESEEVEEAGETLDEASDAPELEEPAAVAEPEDDGAADEPDGSFSGLGPFDDDEGASASESVEQSDGNREKDVSAPEPSEEPEVGSADAGDPLTDKLRGERDKIVRELERVDVDTLIAGQTRLGLDIETAARRLEEMRERHARQEADIARLGPMQKRAETIDRILEDPAMLDLLRSAGS
jgi:hypothetical protein